MLENNWISVSFGNDKTHRLKVSLYIITSGLKNSITIFNIEDSMIYTRELIEAWQLNYIWKIIFIYIVESIWIWNLYVWDIILKLYKLYLNDICIDKFEEKWVYQAVYILCISSKNRENYYMTNLINNFSLWSEEDREFINKYCIEGIYKSKSKKKQKDILNMIYEDFKDYINKDLLNIYKECLINCWNLNWKDGINLFFINFYLIKKYNIWLDFYKNWKNEWMESIRNEINNFKFTFPNIEEFKVYLSDKQDN